MRNPVSLGLAVGLAMLFSAGTAAAQDFDFDYEETDEPEYFEEEEPGLLTPWGLSFSVGGGVGGYTDGDTRDFADDVAGIWEARLTAGTRRPVAIEAAYIGNAQGIDALGLDNDAVLVGTALEGVLRVNFTDTTAWQPYALVGAGWRHYELTNADFNTSSVNSDDDVFEVPVGAGLTYRFTPFLLDARGVFRPAIGNDLIEGEATPLHNWQATLRAGWEF